MEDLTKHQELYGGVVFAMSAPQASSTLLLLALTLQTDALAGVALTYSVVLRNSCMLESSRPLSAHWPRAAKAQPISPDGTCVTELSKVFFALSCTRVLSRSYLNLSVTHI